ncbi:hypothetical protein LTR27_005426 [Elasticomyces elasticus]|nr:hypothetical protein LTR27_005426 [Elasticomyces elasticus]
MSPTASKLVVLAVILGGVTALPEPGMLGRAACAGTSVVANFDGLVPDFGPFGGSPYNPTPRTYIPGLDFQAIAFGPASNGLLLSFIEPDSKNNVASAGASEVAEGLPTIIVDNNKITSFTLKNFAYGCMLATGTPVACSFTLTGYTFSGVRKCGFPFSYKPAGLLGGQAMQKTADGGVNFAECFTKAGYVKMSNIKDGTGLLSKLVVPVLDTLELDLYSRCT